ncbi:PA3496 family putative envelope integrity protein [Neptunomonas japonica]|uniref:Uncharacterized protein n=1 Tax=Neptunomonas japonica JAMM 1380 TaxID=1441457 RepID=A0A7R6PW00_9GAMM|nr:hypothetical protein [Neptunomonas japonica]BBB31610.1 conserved hypothetical protein [Neptunomonas japonica JAMM 1380]
MLKHNTNPLNEVQLEIMNALMGYEDDKNLISKKQATKRLFQARRAIEERRERHSLAKHIDREAWYDSL